MTAINAMAPFQDVFHVGSTGSKLSVVTSLYAVYVTSHFVFEDQREIPCRDKH
jgi:hypothetical protein